MTRWKRERVRTLFVMHAHNRWSEWLYAILDACHTLGIPVSHRSYRNGSGDGSVSTDYIVPGACLERVGGMERVKALAEKAHVERLAWHLKEYE